MPRHAFRYSREFLQELRSEISSAFLGVEPHRFGQESQYTSAILGRLHGIEVISWYGEYARIEGTDIDDRGRGSAEHRYGADFVITATVGDSTKKVRKAILVQVKNQPIDTLSASSASDLKEQITRMKAVVSSPKVAGIRRDEESAMLEMSSGNKVLSDMEYSKSDFPEYFNQRVITTLDGTTDETIIEALQDSHLKKLDVLVKRG